MHQQIQIILHQIKKIKIEIMNKNHSASVINWYYKLELRVLHISLK